MLHADDPIDGETTADELERQSLVAHMTRVLASLHESGGSSVCSLVGSWGSGKSSVINLLEKDLPKNEQSWAVVHFNPWAYPDDASLQSGFFTELDASLADQEPNKANAKDGRALKSLAAVLRFSAPMVSALSALTVVDGSPVVNAVAQLVDPAEPLSKIMKRTEDILRETKVPFLVIMDDVDRLDPSELMMVAKLVRLVGRLPNVHYLLAFDETTILDVLARTPLVPEDNPARAKEYLEKIIQVRFDVPRLRRGQAMTLVEQRVDVLRGHMPGVLLPEHTERLMNLFSGQLGDRLRTPRSINRLFAQVPYALERLNGEVDPVDFIVLTWVRMYEPAVFAWLEQRRSYVLNLSAERLRAQDLELGPLKYYNEFFSELQRLRVAPEHREGLATLLGELFPYLGADALNRPRAHVETDGHSGAHRAGNSDYFDRYFSHDVPGEDFSDQVLRQAIESISAGETTTGAVVDLTEALTDKTDLVMRKVANQQLASVPFARWLLALDAGDPETSEGRNKELILRLQLFFLSHDDRMSFLQSASDVESLRRIANAALGLRLERGLPAQVVATRDENALPEARSDVSLRLVKHLDSVATPSPFDFSDPDWALFRQLLELDVPAASTWLKVRTQGGWDIFQSLAAAWPIEPQQGGNWRPTMQTADYRKLYTPEELDAFFEGVDLEAEEQNRIVFEEPVGMPTTPESRTSYARLLVASEVRIKRLRGTWE